MAEVRTDGGEHRGPHVGGRTLDRMDDQGDLVGIGQAVGGLPRPADADKQQGQQCRHHQRVKQQQCGKPCAHAVEQPHPAQHRTTGTANM